MKPGKRKSIARRKSSKPGAKNQKRPLTPKQQLFVREYLVDMNATQAYLRAGYKVSEKVAAVSGLKMLRNAKISSAINKPLGRRLKKLEISNDTVLQEIAKMAFCNMFDYIAIQKDGTAIIDLSKLTREQAAAIQELSFEEGLENGEDGAKPVKKVKFKLSDKKGNLDMLGRYLKLFSDTTPVVSKQTAKILKDVLNGTVTVREAAYKFNMLGLPLPEVLKIELSKQEAAPPEDGTYSATPVEELERRAAEAIAAAEGQPRTFVPGRKREVEDLKEELKSSDSFAIEGGGE